MDSYAAVSIIVPVYNAKDGLKRCIDSILKQTYRDFEIIIVDDCSTDETMEYIDLHYGDITDIDIIYIRNESRLGFGASANIGISNAKGSYIAFHAPDAWWPSDKLEKQVSYLQNERNTSSAIYGVTEYVKNWGSEYCPRETLGMNYKAGDIYFALLSENSIGLESLLIQKDALYTIGGFAEDMPALEDYEFVIRMAKAANISFLDETLAVKYETNKMSEAPEEEIIQNRIAAHFCLMELYQEDLKKFDMKKRKFETVYEEADQCGMRHLFFQAVPALLKDADYVPCLQDKIWRLHPSSNPEQVETKDISGVTACTGCMACLNGCPVDAIHMECDIEGFLVPVIDAERCIRCGRCKEICPVCNEIADKGVLLPNECYAIMGKTEIRRNSSSGGVFGILAESILAEGGYVAGVVWNKDWQVEHIVSDDRNDVERMRSSKYVQSNIGVTYRKIKALLESGKQVLFTGCACQTAGLKCYLGKEYDTLLLAEVVCHGVPSQAVFDAYIRDIDEVDHISFRDKTIFGWNPGLYIRYRNGGEYKGQRDDSYLFGFLNNWFLRKSCYECKFKNKKYSDIVIGDFWGIRQIPGFDDGWGTSFVTVNTAKGAEHLEKIRSRFEKITCLRTSHAVQNNRCISESVSMPACRELFFSQWSRKQDTAWAIEAVKAQIHFDIALVVLWSMNYGNALTNYALYCYLQKQGKHVVILDDCIKPQKQFREFAQRHYTLSSEYFPAFRYDMLNHSCETFVVGSDQTWNSQIYEEDWNYFYLDFAAENRKKVSYASSFGTPEGAMASERGREFLKRFHAVSVREGFGVGLCENLYEIKAQKVLDPVFLLEKEDYEALAEKIQVKEKEPYIITYLLNPTVEKRKMCLEVQARLGGIRMINMIDAYGGGADYSRKILECDHIKADLSVEEWLCYMRYSEFVITDSFHGTCFAMIFEKNFITFKARETARFENFKNYAEIRSRILEDGTDHDIGGLIAAIDYSKVKRELLAEKKKSEQFIKENIL